MFVDRRRYGQHAESVAEQYLRRKGYRILARNARSPAGELDLVAESGAALIFIEVKARRSDAYGGAPHAVDERKQARLIRLAAQYLARRNIRDRRCRFDVVLLSEAAEAAPRIEHIENAFEVPGDDLRW